MSSEDPQSTLRFAGGHYESHDVPVVRPSEGLSLSRLFHSGRDRPHTSWRRFSKRSRWNRLVRVANRCDAGAQPYPPDAFATGARAPGSNFPIGDAPVRARSHPGRGRPLTCTSFSRAAGSIVRFVPVRAKSEGRLGVLAGYGLSLIHI